jgi:hypothetical protein
VFAAALYKAFPRFAVDQKPKNGKKTEENRKKPVETGVLLLTIASKSRKVNGGRFSRTRVNTGLPGAARGCEVDMRREENRQQQTTERRAKGVAAPSKTELEET